MCGATVDRLVWVEAMDRSLDDMAMLTDTMARLHQTETANNDPELRDVCRAARDLLRRWQSAKQSADPFQADILLHDFRPIRPYARSLGEWITSRAEVVGGPHGRRNDRG